MDSKKLITLDILSELSSKQKTYIDNTKKSILGDVEEAYDTLLELANFIKEQAEKIGKQQEEIDSLKNKLAKYDERFGYPESDTGDWSKAFLLIDPDESEDESDNS